MRLLPTTEEQRQLLETTSQVIAKQGFESFVSAPIIVPNSELLAAAATRSASGVAMITHRLLRSVGHLDVRIRVENEAESSREQSPSCGAFERDAPAWYEGSEGDNFIIGIDDRFLGDPTLLLGALAHVVAHIDLARSGGHDADEIATDIAACCLGMGVLIANATDVHRSTGTTYTYTVRQASVGFLGPQSAAFVLAAQATEREYDDATLRELERHLDPNQAECFRAACGHFDSMDVSDVLVLPDPSEWPAMRALEALPSQLDATITAECAAMDARVKPASPGPPRSTFRVRGHRGIQFAVVGALLAPFPCSVFREQLSFGTATLALVAMSAMFGLFGRRFRRDSCSRTECGAMIPVGAELCPKCGSVVRGEIASMEERLEAEERLDDRAPPRGYRG